MPMTRFPRGVSGWGVPALGSLPVPFASTGRYHFVSSANGNDGNRGDDPTRALATIGQAQTNGVAGDGIIIDPRSSLVENVVITKNNLTIISAASLIGGRDRATIEPASGIPLRVTTGIG